MKQKQSVPRGWSILALVVLALSLSACATQASITESPTRDGLQSRNITVYESPT